MKFSVCGVTLHTGAASSDFSGKASGSAFDGVNSRCGIEQFLWTIAIKKTEATESVVIQVSATEFKGY